MFAKLIYDVYGPDHAENLVLCIHGAGLNGTMFAEFAAAFTDEYKLVLVDLFGHGRSDYTDPAFYTPTAYCEDLVSLLNCLSFKQVFCIGNGIGAFIAYKLATALGSPVIGVVADSIDAKVSEEFFASLRNPNVETGLVRLGIDENEIKKYLKYFVRNFDVIGDGIKPRYDHEAFKKLNQSSFEQAQTICESACKLPCHTMLLAPKGTIRDKQSNKLTIYQVDYANRVEYSPQEIERIVKWIQSHSLNEEDRVRNLLGIKSGRPQDIIH